MPGAGGPTRLSPKPLSFNTEAAQPRRADGASTEGSAFPTPAGAPTAEVTPLAPGGAGWSQANRQRSTRAAAAPGTPPTALPVLTASTSSPQRAGGATAQPELGWASASAGEGGAHVAVAPALEPAVAAVAPRSGADVGGDLSRLNDTQRQVLEYAARTAAQGSGAAHEALLARVRRLRFTESDLAQTLEFVRKAEVTITFPPDRVIDTSHMPPNPARRGDSLIDVLMADGSYRNQFETKISGGNLSPMAGGARDKAEELIFGGRYNGHELIPAERPKYGAFNLANTGYGGGGTQYGDAYLVLKQSTKARTTFTPVDSLWAKPEELGTADAAEHVLAGLADTDVRMIMDVALGRKERGTRFSSEFGYVEAQVHGPVEFDKDVEALVANKRHKGTPMEGKLREFAAKNHVELRWLSIEPHLEFNPNTGASFLVDGETITPDQP